MNNTNNATAEAAFEKAKRIFKMSMMDRFMEKFKNDSVAADIACTDWVNNLKLSQSEVRLEVELNTASTVFQFGMTVQDSNSTNFVFNTESRLAPQNSLVASEYGIFVGNPASRTDTNWALRTYGNINDFTVAQGAAIDNQLFGNGTFRVTTNNDVVIPYRGMWNHLYRPQTQQTAPVGAGSPGDQIRGAEDGMITMQPNLLLIGTKGYVPEIKLPVNLAAAATFSRAIIIFRGVLAQNSTSYS